jgi:preprotein translocase subunit YajC
MINFINFLLSQGCFPAPQGTGETPPAGACGQDGFTSLIFIALIFFIFYFLFIRPSQQKQREHQELINLLAKGDKIVTQGGIHGKVVEIKTNTVKLKVDSNTELEIEKNMVAKVVKKES